MPNFTMKSMKEMKNNKCIKKFTGLSIIFFILLPFFLAGCQSYIEAKKADDYMALYKAVEDNDYEKAQKLLDKGVSPNPYLFDSDRVMNGEIVLTDNMYFAGLRDAPVVLAAQNGNLEMMKLLLAHGAKPDWCCCSCVTALHEAIICGQVEIVRVLLDYGADTRIPYDMGPLPLELAEQNGNEEIILMIKKYNLAVDPNGFSSREFEE